MARSNIHKIFIRTDASRQLGMGHIYRSLALSQEFKSHECTIYIAQDTPLGADVLDAHSANYKTVQSDEDFRTVCEAQKPDLVIIDMLDTEKRYIKALKKTGAKVVTFEDLGSGAGEADLVVNDLYKNVEIDRHRQLSGLRNAIISPLFEAIDPPQSLNKDVKNILITYGGSDPAHLTERALEGLAKSSYGGRVTVILGPGRPDDCIDLGQYGLKGEVLKSVTDMPAVMRKADFALCSAGRTITELMTCGVPMLVMCQNMKELMHTHANCQFGAINLGLGRYVSIDTLAAHIVLFLGYDLRKNLHERALYEIAERKNAYVVERILSCLEG